MSSDRNLEARYARILEQDDDAPFGATDPVEAARINRTIWFAVGGVAVAGMLVGGALLVAANQHPRPQAAASAEPFMGSSSPSATETSASPSASESSASATPSESATSASPTPSESHSASSIPSPSRSTHKVILPSAAPTSSAPETHSSAPQDCVWPESNHVVTVGECGDHTAYNDTQRSGAHQLGPHMQFESPCLTRGMVEIHYGTSTDYLENSGYFAVTNNC